MKLVAPNKVLIRIVEKNVDRRTPSGIYLISPTDTDWNKSVYVERTGVVINQSAVFKKNNRFLWMPVCETKVGDVIWFDYMIGANTDTIITEEGEYYLMDYFDMIVVKRGDELVPVNGYVLCSLVKDEVKSELSIDTKKYDARYGIVEYIGGINTYFDREFVDDNDINIGDKCVFSRPPIMLEEEYTSRLGKQYSISQRREIIARERDGKMTPTEGNLIVEPYMDRARGNIIIPEIYRKPNGYGKVIESKIKGIKAGDEIKFFPEAGTKIDVDGKKVIVVGERCILVKL